MVSDSANVPPVSPGRTGRKPVGITKGPGESAHEYTFVSRDDEQVLKNGEYVYYELNEPDEWGQNGAQPVARRVLGRIIKRVPLQLYPDTFLAEPEVSPAQVAAMVGYDARANELFELHVAIMGYYDPASGSFINPWIPPQSGKQIFLADDEMLSQILCRRRVSQPGSATIGSLLTRTPGAVPIVLSVKDFVSTHLAIIASTGAGKSYLASVIIEELMRPYNKACVLIVDPHGEYGTLDQLPNLPEFSEESGEEGVEGYRAQVRVYRPEQVKVRLSTLNMGDMRHLLPEMTEKQQHLLSRALRKVNEMKRGTPWSAQDLMEAIRKVARSKNDEDGEGADDSSTVHALMWRIEQRFVDSFTFDDVQHLDLREIFKPGQCTVLQLNEVDERDQQVIVATLLRRLYQARMNTERGKVHSGESYLPYPVFVLLEEGHHFAPSGTEVVSTQILKQVLAEGRKFGIGVGIISQRPGKLDADVLSQCQTQCIMRIVNEIDQKSVAAAIEGVGRDLLDNLPALSKGQVIVAGAAVNTPVICRVRQRLTRHGGESKDAPDIWQKYFSSEARASRRLQEAPLGNNQGFSLLK
ncbi:ATP-binding protein [Thermogemmatispora onikobensis]|uniref:ATP-binding protein n=1 Tax=Thermogemmatispora onikobensis TaxID=732234 RepID=UPI0008531BB7|nr:ATP-binding protein [Thermogemmatispora onikobensis]